MGHLLKTQIPEPFPEIASALGWDLGWDLGWAFSQAAHVILLMDQEREGSMSVFS